MSSNWLNTDLNHVDYDNNDAVTNMVALYIEEIMEWFYHM